MTLGTMNAPVRFERPAAPGSCKTWDTSAAQIGVVRTAERVRYRLCSYSCTGWPLLGDKGFLRLC